MCCAVCALCVLYVRACFYDVSLYVSVCCALCVALCVRKSARTVQGGRSEHACGLRHFYDVEREIGDTVLFVISP